MEGAVTIKTSKTLNGRPALKALRAIVIGSVAGAILCAAFLGVFSLAFVSAENIPQGLLSPLIIAVSIISAFLAGLSAAKISGKRGLLFGAAAGLLLFTLFLFSGLIVSTKATSDPAVSGIRLLTMVLAGSIGGIIAVSGKPRHARRK